MECVTSGVSLYVALGQVCVSKRERERDFSGGNSLNQGVCWTDRRLRRPWNVVATFFREGERGGRKQRKKILFFIFLDDDADAAVETEAGEGGRERALKDPRRNSLSFKLLDRTKAKKMDEGAHGSSSGGISSQCKKRIFRWKEKKKSASRKPTTPVGENKTKRAQNYYYFF